MKVIIRAVFLEKLFYDTYKSDRGRKRIEKKNKTKHHLKKALLMRALMEKIIEINWIEVGIIEYTGLSS